MNKWVERSQEVANLLNPAFCCIALTSSVSIYTTFIKEGMPLSLSFIVLSILMNEKSRILLPRSYKTSLANWLDDYPEVRLSLHKTIVPLKPYVQESVLFGLQHEWLFMTNAGNLKTSYKEKEVNKIINKFDGDTKEILRRSNLLGKWFALSGTTETVMTLWGVKP